MSMSLLVASFSSVNGKLDADYSDLSKKFHVNDFINDFVSDDFMTSF